MTEKKRRKNPFRRRRKEERQYTEHLAFTFEDMITLEEKLVMTGVANGQEFDKDSVNAQLIKARAINK